MRRKISAILAALVCATGTAVPAATNIYQENMANVADWGTYQVAFTTNGSSTNGVATITENGPVNWGKSWSYAGFFDVSAYPWLHLKVNSANTNRLYVALSYQYDQFYQIMATITNSGWFSIPISNWIFNVNHNYGGGLDVREYTFVQLVKEGEGSSAQVDELYISDYPQPYPGNIVFKDMMNTTVNWGVYNATHAANGLGQTVLTSTNTTWGRNWRWAGNFEITKYNWLKFNVSSVSANATNVRVSISGPSDFAVQNLGFVTNAGKHIYYVGGWTGNNPTTTEPVYVRFDVSKLHTVTIDQVEFSDAPSLIP